MVIQQIGRFLVALDLCCKVINCMIFGTYIDMIKLMPLMFLYHDAMLSFLKLKYVWIKSKSNIKNIAFKLQSHTSLDYFVPQYGHTISSHCCTTPQLKDGCICLVLSMWELNAFHWFTIKVASVLVLQHRDRYAELFAILELGEGSSHLALPIVV